MIFLTAAEELGVWPRDSFVIEDAQSGIKAAKAGGMAGLGVARQGGEELLHEAGADLVVESLDEVDLDAMREGRLARK
jgi:beta-phosphoglucomutase-like phosphatase (HAD superfamily)